MHLMSDILRKMAETFIDKTVNFLQNTEPGSKPLLNSKSNTCKLYSSSLVLILSVIFKVIFEDKIVNMPENNLNL